MCVCDRDEETGEILPRIVFAAKDGGSNYRHELLLQQPQLLGVFPLLGTLLWRGLRNEALRVRLKRSGEILIFVVVFFAANVRNKSPRSFCHPQTMPWTRNPTCPTRSRFLYIFFIFFFNETLWDHLCFTFYSLISHFLAHINLYKRWIIFAAGRIFKYAKNSNMIRSFEIWYSNFFKGKFKQKQMKSKLNSFRNVNIFKKFTQNVSYLF